jgi:hypothetical protein
MNANEWLNATDFLSSVNIAFTFLNIFSVKSDSEAVVFFCSVLMVSLCEF